MRRGELDEVEHSSFHDSLRAALHAQFATDVVDVPLHCVDAQDEATSDLAVGRALQQEPQHLAFPLGERFHERVGARRS